MPHLCYFLAITGKHFDDFIIKVERENLLYLSKKYTFSFLLLVDFDLLELNVPLLRSYHSWPQWLLLSKSYIVLQSITL